MKVHSLGSGGTGNTVCSESGGRFTFDVPDI